MHSERRNTQSLGVEGLDKQSNQALSSRCREPYMVSFIYKKISLGCMWKVDLGLKNNNSDRKHEEKKRGGIIKKKRVQNHKPQEKKVRNPMAFQWSCKCVVFSGAWDVRSKSGKVCKGQLMKCFILVGYLNVVKH